MFSSYLYNITIYDVFTARMRWTYARACICVHLKFMLDPFYLNAGALRTCLLPEMGFFANELLLLNLFVYYLRRINAVHWYYYLLHYYMARRFLLFLLLFIIIFVIYLFIQFLHGGALNSVVIINISLLFYFCAFQYGPSANLYCECIKGDIFIYKVLKAHKYIQVHTCYFEFLL